MTYSDVNPGPQFLGLVQTYGGFKLADGITNDNANLQKYTTQKNKTKQTKNR